MGFVREFASLLTGIVLLTGCAEESLTEAGDAIQPTLSSIQANIFTPKCAVSGCHVGTGAPLGLDFSTRGTSFTNLVGVASQQVPALGRVTSGNPDSSYIVIKLEGSPRMASGTERMPRGGTALSTEEIAAVRQWIQNGAQNN
jgi:mono/diheme cytochrome c family protein